MSRQCLLDTNLPSRQINVFSLKRQARKNMLVDFRPAGGGEAVSMRQPFPAAEEAGTSADAAG